MARCRHRRLCWSDRWRWDDRWRWGYRRYRRRAVAAVGCGRGSWRSWGRADICRFPRRRLCWGRNIWLGGFRLLLGLCRGVRGGRLGRCRRLRRRCGGTDVCRLRGHRCCLLVKLRDVRRRGSVVRRSRAAGPTPTLLCRGLGRSRDSVDPLDTGGFTVAVCRDQVFDRVENAGGPMRRTPAQHDLAVIEGNAISDHSGTGAAGVIDVPDEGESARKHERHRPRSALRAPALLYLPTDVTGTSCAIMPPPVDTPCRKGPFWHARSCALSVASALGVGQQRGEITT